MISATKWNDTRTCGLTVMAVVTGTFLFRHLALVLQREAIRMAYAPAHLHIHMDGGRNVPIWAIANSCKHYTDIGTQRLADLRRDRDTWQSWFMRLHILLHLLTLVSAAAVTLLRALWPRRDYQALTRIIMSNALVL